MSNLNSNLKNSFFGNELGKSPFGNMFADAFKNNPFQMRNERSGSKFSNREISGLMKSMNVSQNDMGIFQDLTSPTFGLK